MANKFSIKKLAAGVLALLMVVTALPVSGIAAVTSKAADTDTVEVYRSYNPNSGEHLFTVNKSEHETVVSDGRDDEGVRWLAPKTSKTPIYRAYNPNTGEHLLVPQEEAEWLATKGWDNEGIKLYSDDDKTEGIYRLYNANAINTKYPAASHTYTGDKEEADWLVEQGWTYDNDGDPVIYAVELIDEEEDYSDVVALIDTNGLQSDGTAKSGDTLAVTYGANFGAPTSITWYVNGAVKTISVAGSLSVTQSTDGTWAGLVYAIVENSKGERFQTNTIEVTTAEARAEIWDFEIIDDTVTANGANIAFNAEDTNAIVKVTLNRNYDGKFYIFKDTEEKFIGNNKVAERTVAIGTAGAASDGAINSGDKVTVAKNFTAAAAIAKTTEGQFIANADGSYTYEFLVSTGITRGKNYYIVFDQDDADIDDNVNASDETKNGEINKFDELATAPYIEAPSSIKLKSPTALTTSYEVTLYDEKDEVYKAVDNAGTVAPITVYTASNKSIGTTQSVTDGVATITGNTAVTSSKYYAVWAGKKGVFGEEAVLVKSEESSVLTAAATGVTAVSKNDAGKTVVATVTGQKTSGVVVITADPKKLADPTTYSSISEVVAKGTGTNNVTIEGAISKAGQYYPVFIPEDTDTYDFVIGNPFTVTAQIASYEMSELNGVKVNTVTAAVVTAKDQFGDDVSNPGQPAPTMIAVNEKDSTIISGTENIKNTAVQTSAKGLVFEASSTNGALKITAESSGTAPTKGETWVGNIGSTKSVLIATCDSAGKIYDASTWTLQIAQLTGAEKEIVPETGVGTATAIVDENGDVVTEITATSVYGSDVVELNETYYVVDQYGNKMTAAEDGDTATDKGMLDTSTNTNAELKFTWDTSGLITGIKYTNATAPGAGTDYSDPEDTYGATITIERAKKVLTSADITNTAGLANERKIAAKDKFTIAANNSSGFASADLGDIEVSYCLDTSTATPSWVKIENVATDTAEKGTISGLEWTLGTGTTEIDTNGTNKEIKIVVTAKGNFTGTVTYMISESKNKTVKSTALQAE